MRSIVDEFTVCAGHLTLSSKDVPLTGGASLASKQETPGWSVPCMTQSSSHVRGLQPPAVKVLDDWRALAASEGLFIEDPAAQLADPGMTRRVLTEAGYTDVQVGNKAKLIAGARQTSAA